MIRSFFIVCFIICCFFAKAQHTSRKEIAVKGLQATFSASVLTAYQENAKEKIEDLFQYLQLLSDTDVSEDLKKEVEKNIYILFKDREVLLPDFFNDAKNQIKLSSLIERLKKSSLKFTLLDVVDGPILLDSWQTNYKLQIFNKDEVQSLSLSQTIYLSNEVKIFGKYAKNVWQIRLGAVK